jgi:hypothetical protein
MIRLFLLIGIAALLWLLIVEIKRYALRDRKLEEYRDVVVEGELVDIDLDIAMEKARQKEVSDEVENIKSKIKWEKNND